MNVTTRLPLLLLSLMLSNISPAHALSMNQAVSEAIGNSPVVQKAQAEYQETSWKKTEAFSTFLPSLILTANYFTNTQYELVNPSIPGFGNIAIPGIYPTTQAALNFTYPLFDGFQGIKKYSAAGLQENAAGDSLEWTKFQLESEVRIKFSKAVAAIKLEAAAEQNVKTVQDHVNQVTNLKRSGVATNYDLLRAEVQLNEAKTEFLQASDNVILSRKLLALALGSENDNRPLEGDLTLPRADKIKDLALPTQSSRKDIRAMEERTRASGKMADAAGDFWIPRLSFAAQGIQYNDLTTSATDWNNYRTAYSMGFFMTWNLFDGMVSIAKSQEASYQKIQAEKSLRQAQLQVPYDFDFWKRRYLYSSSLYDARKSDLEKSEESVRLARLSFRAGARTITEVLDAQLELFRSRSGVINAQVDSFEALTNIEMALGRRL